MKARELRQVGFHSKLGPVLLLVLPGVLTGVAAAHRAQQVPAAPVNHSTLPGVNEPRDPFAEQTASKMVHLREDERRKRLMEDTTRLLALTTELKTEVDNTSRDELSLDVVRKATEIEKLAHDVRERMKN